MTDEGQSEEAQPEEAQAEEAHEEDLSRLTFGIQLSDAYLFAGEVTRTDRQSDDVLPSLVVEEARGFEPELGENGFLVMLSVRVEVPIRDSGKLTIEATVAGEFASAEPIDSGFLQEFAPRDGAVILWPFMRAFVGQLGALTQVEIPTLPTLDVRAARFAAERNRRLVGESSDAPIEP